MGTNRTGIGIGIGIPFKNNALGQGRIISPDLLTSLKAVVICDGKTNEDSDRAILRNLVDKDNPFVASNFAWKLNSGYGKYETDFTAWQNVHVHNATPTKIVVNSIDDINKFGWLLSTKAETPIPSFTVRVKNLGNKRLVYYYNDGSDKAVILKDGINILPASTGVNAVSNGFNCSKRVDFIGLTIEQLPTYDGALVFDGVNDRVISTKTMQEMVGDTQAVTVVSMIHQLSVLASTNHGYTNYIDNNYSPQQYYRNEVDNIGKTGIYGYSAKDGSSAIVINSILGDKGDYATQNSRTYAGLLTSNAKFSVTGRSQIPKSDSSSVAWYWTIIANKVLTTDEIHQVIAYYNLDKHVKPDIYYNVKKQGLTNKNHVQFNDKLIDYSGNGHDMQMYNIGWDETSGINAYGSLVLDGVNDYGRVNNIPVKKDYTVVTERQILDNTANDFALVSDREFESEESPDLYQTFVFEKNKAARAFSYGQATTVTRDDSLKFSYQSKYSYNGKAIIIGDRVGNTKLLLGAGIIKDNVISEFIHAAINSLLLFPYSLDEFLIERQLKRHKLGTLHPDLIEFRPIVKSDGVLGEINYFLNNYSTRLYPGDYIPKGSTVYINIVSTNEVDEFKYLKINGKEISINENIGSTNRVYIGANITYTKAPLKIEVSLDNYIRFEDIQQPYPFYLSLVNAENDEEYTWGDKIKYGTKLQVIKKSNLLVGVYKQTIDTMFTWNGSVLSQTELMAKEFIVGKDKLVFGVQGLACEFTNEPNVIAAPQKLRLPNISYKRLGYIPDISGHGNNIKLYNSGYSGMSGANGYGTNFTKWFLNSATAGTLLVKEESYIEYQAITNLQNLLSRRYSDSETFALYADVDIELRYSGEESFAFIKAGKATKVTIPKAGTVLLRSTNAVIAGDIITIQQVGLYDGAFCFDGVNDYGVINKSIVSKQQFVKLNRLSNKNASIIDNRTANIKNSYIISSQSSTAYVNYDTYIDGILNKNILTEELNGITHNAMIQNETNVAAPVIIMTSYDRYNYLNAAMYAYASFPEISDESEIIRFNEIMGIEGKYVEKPNYYWDTFGKKNTDADKATIIDQVTKLPANALNLKNVGYEGMSGYDGYPVSLNAREGSMTWNLHTNIDGGTFAHNKSTLSNIPIGGGYIYTYIKNTTLTGFNREIPSFRVKITGMDSTKFNLRYYYLASASAVAPANFSITSDGVHTLPKSFASDGKLTASQVWIGFGFVGVNGTTANVTGVNFSMEVLPDYENGLALDGVNDYLENTTLPAVTDFTFITKRKNLLSTYEDGTMYIMKGLENNKWALLGDYWSGGKNTQYSFGQTNIVTPFDLIGFITPTSYNGTAMTKGTTEDSTGMHIGGWSKYWNGVFYNLMLFDRTINMLSINMIKNLMNKDAIVDLSNPVFKD